jgi:2-keto-4-pentenoate hydratase/2-oxohepta-3-ene-1,7-dioic acid hydratase in catechol pathway
MGIGRNYAEHAGEQGAAVPDRPMVFVKSPASAILSGDAIVIPRICASQDQVDYEGELAVILGRAVRDATESDTADPDSGIILGYAPANDVSARWWQKQGAGGQFTRGKSFDTFCPIGPWITTARSVAELGGPHRLRIRTTLSGEVVQSDSVSSMVFSVPALIADLSRGATLPPGTVILTGTPAGVGMARTPPRFLKPGDTVAIEIGTDADPAALGRLENPVAAE